MFIDETLAEGLLAGVISDGLLLATLPAAMAEMRGRKTSRVGLLKGPKISTAPLGCDSIWTEARSSREDFCGLDSDGDCG